MNVANVRRFAVALCIVACGSRAALDSPDEHPRAVLGAAVDFGDQSCGDAADVAVPLANAMKTPHPTNTLTWSATATAPFTIVGAASGVIAPGGSTTLTLHVATVTAKHAGDLVTGTLHVITNDPEHASFDLPIQLRASGAELVMPSMLDFGETDSAPPTNVSLKNVGTMPLDVVVTAPQNAAFSAFGPTSTSLGSGTAADFAYAFHPIKPGLVVETLPIAVKGAICGSIPAQLELRGRGFVGEAKLSSTKLDFGLVDCGAQGAPQTVKLTNTGPAPFGFSTSFGAQGGSYAVTPTSGTVPPGSSIDLVVTPALVATPVDVLPNILGNVLTVTTTIPQDPPHVVTLTQTPHGASILVPLSTDFGRQRVGTSHWLFVPMTNVGNSDAVLIGANESPIVASTTIPATSLPVSTEVIVSVVSDDVGVTQARPYIFHPAPGYPICKVGPGTATWRGFAFAAGPSTASATLACVYDANDWEIFCSGTNTLVAQGLPPAVSLMGGSFTSAHLATGAWTDILVADEGYALGMARVVRDGNTNVGFLGPPWNGSNSSAFMWVGAGGPFQLCATHTVDYPEKLACWGFNPNGAWGNGTTSSTLTTNTLSVAMGGVSGVVAFAASTNAGYAVLDTGRILAAGTKSGNNLGTTSVADGLVANPVFVDGIFDAISIQAFANGACAVRANGSVVCWDGTHALADHGGFTDALEIAVVGPDDFTVRRVDGTIANWNGVSIVPIPGPAFARFLRGTNGGRIVTFDNGAAARVVNGALSYVPGFEGP